MLASPVSEQNSTVDFSSFNSFEINMMPRANATTQNQENRILVVWCKTKRTTNDEQDQKATKTILEDADLKYWQFLLLFL